MLWHILESISCYGFYSTQSVMRGRFAILMSALFCEQVKVNPLRILSILDTIRCLPYNTEKKNWRHSNKASEKQARKSRIEMWDLNSRNQWWNGKGRIQCWCRGAFNSGRSSKEQDQECPGCECAGEEGGQRAGGGGDGHECSQQQVPLNLHALYLWPPPRILHTFVGGPQPSRSGRKVRKFFPSFPSCLLPSFLFWIVE